MIGWHDTPWMWGSMIVFWSGLVVVVFFTVVAMSKGGAEQSGPPPNEILAQRYARGGMTAEKHRERRETLESMHEPRS